MSADRLPVDPVGADAVEVGRLLWRVLKGIEDLATATIAIDAMSDDDLRDALFVVVYDRLNAQEAEQARAKRRPRRPRTRP
jgi:hypothetical protein